MKHKLRESAEIIGERSRRGLNWGGACRPHPEARPLSGGYKGATMDPKQGSDFSLWM